jgi:hypothetical protein
MGMCTKARHDAIKADATAFSKLELAGIQNVGAGEGEPAFQLELRNCSCGSTLARRILEPALPNHR